MITETLEYLRNIFKPSPIITEADGRVYAVTPTDNGPKLGDLIKPPTTPTLLLSSATGFVDAFVAGIDDFKPKRAAVQVVDHQTIALVSMFADDYGRRHEWLRATSQEQNPFPFDAYQTPEMFLINLQSGFLPTEEIVQLQRLASALTNESSIGTQDDGLSQAITVKQGAVSRGEVKLPSRIKLFPYRTFREIDPIQSEFMVRLKGTPGQLPSIALLSIDAGGWKHDTALLVKRWLVAQLPAGTTVIA